MASASLESEVDHHLTEPSPLGRHKRRSSLSEAIAEMSLEGAPKVCCETEFGRFDSKANLMV